MERELSMHETFTLYKQMKEVRKQVEWEKFIDNMVFSYSNLTSFENCKYCWFKNYALQIRDRSDNPFAEYGTLMHKIIEKLDTKEWDKCQAINTLVAEMEKINLPTFYNNDLNVSYYEQAVSFINNYNPLNTTLCVEKEVEFTIGKYTFKGYIDRIATDDEGNIYIIDHKSKGKFNSKQELKDYARQLYLYSIPIIKQMGKQPKKLIFNLFRRQKLEEIEFNYDDFMEAQEWALRTIEEMKNTKDFPVTTNDFFRDNLCNFKNDQEHLNMNPLHLYNYKPRMRWVSDTK